MAERGRPKEELVLSDHERATLDRWARRPKSAQRLAMRCRIVLHALVGTQLMLGGAAWWSRIATRDDPQPMPVMVTLVMKLGCALR